MKKLSILDKLTGFALAMVVMLAFSCSGGDTTTPDADNTTPDDTPDNTEVEAVTKTVNGAESSLAWTGSKVAGSHNGTVNITQGEVTVKGNEVVSGWVEVDMTSIAVLDLEEGSQMNSDLMNHLKSGDFFMVDSFSTARIDIGTVDAGTASGTLTIKGMENEIEFPVSMDDAGVITCEVSVDRTLYDVQYGSGKFFENLGDNMIDDNFDLSVSLVLN